MSSKFFSISHLFIWSLFVWVGFAPGTGIAQLPNTNIYLFDLDLSNPVQPLINPRFLTGFNADGYNNQPAFFHTDEIWMTSNYLDTAQTDIWALQLHSGVRKRITHTRTSEYSPTPLPGRDGFSTVVVESESEKTQRLWKYPTRPSSTCHPLFADVTGVGYHCWLSNDTAALFIVGKPHSLHLMSSSQDQPTYLTSHIGRCLIKDPNGRLLFLQKVTDQAWYIKRYDPHFDRTEIIIKSLAGSEDFCLLPDGSLLMAKENMIYRYDPVADITWRTFFDGSVYGFKQITRLINQSDQQLVLVNQL
ncbi:MAG: hypothetical protein K9I85_08360 [Saprospiraceae bacterium]|nr:hypothetical protein [Saprospiraceae bacterium]